MASISLPETTKLDFMQIENSKKNNIVILDDHKMIGGLIKKSISQFEFVESINLFNQASAFFNHLDANNVDVLIVDVFMSDMNGIEIVKKCREKYCSGKLKIIMLSSSMEYKIITDAINFGADAYLTKDDSAIEILNALTHVRANSVKPYLGENAREVLLYGSFIEEENVRFSPREEQLLKLICKSKTAKEIAYELKLSVNTIHFYTRRLMSKMEVNRTPDLILKAIKKGYVLSENKNFSFNFSA